MSEGNLFSMQKKNFAQPLFFLAPIQNVYRKKNNDFFLNKKKLTKKCNFIAEVC